MIDAKGKRILLLQGPNGPFFRRLHDEFTQTGAHVDKIHLHAGDRVYFWGRPGHSFRGSLEDWPEFLREFVEKGAYDACFLFGDSRPHHSVATTILREAGVRIFVFEEGYLRPHFLTIEPEGVNGRSLLRHSPPSLDAVPPPSQDPVSVKSAFSRSVFHTIVNSLCVTVGAVFFPKYRHHRDVNTVRQAALWTLSGLRLVYFRIKERKTLQRFQGASGKPYFLVGLQVYNDFQVQNSRFNDVRDFIEEVMTSFATEAPPDVELVVKHHPADRAYREYGKFISEHSQKLGISHRVHYVHDQHLPTLLKLALGTVVINSTIGWSSLHHGTPVMSLDSSIYGFFGLSAEGPLDEFWRNPPEVNTQRVEAAERWLKRNNQANGSVWTRVRGAGPSGFYWPEDFTLN